MDRDDGSPAGALASVTHARLRAAQGDTAGARAILGAILLRDPLDEQARGLLDALDGSAGTSHAEPADSPLEAPEPADSRALWDVFLASLRDAPRARGARRLESWAEKIDRNRGERRHAR